jgi:diacylglycerol kinase family enzyme
VRLLLIANVRAGTVTPRKIEFIRRALSAGAEVALERTEGPGHAGELAAAAVRDGVDVVASLGGDGTVNEAANGLAGTAVPLGIIPGGGTNVLARSLRIPRDPVRAAGHLLALLGTPGRRVNLGRAAGRFFTFACGVGLDGEVTRSVERRQALKRTAGHGYFVWSAVRVALLSYPVGGTGMRLRWGDSLEHGRSGLAFAIVQNTRPFTYLGTRPMHVCPRASLHLGLDCYAASLRRLGLVKVALQTLTTGRQVRHPRAVSLHDERRIEVSADVPLPVQMDGEYVGNHERLLLESVPDALSILA